MVKTMKIENWKECIPFAHYLEPLEEAIKAQRKLLAEMKKIAPLQVKYIIEENEDLQDKTINYIKIDNTV